ncbi:terminase family protein [Desulfocurvibacter africanus]|uniref:terminase family protein n=1 Tax=Desulfocurvibacter africanus TaxID=873 RepID=UPI0009DC357C|nr:terminase family protein [Desulfocurvibacter africanus]
MQASGTKTLRLHPRQGVAYRTRATEVLYGGSAGGGKSHLMRVAALSWCFAVPGLQVYIFRRLSDDLWKNHMQGPASFPVLLAEWLQAGFVKINSGKNFIAFGNGPAGGFDGGSKIFLCHCQYERDVFKYQGAEIHVLLMDELTHFTESQYRFLRGRVRLAGLQIPERWQGFFPRILCGSNPGGVGHGWVKHTFEPSRPESRKAREMLKSEGSLVRQFIPARLEDNPSLMESDPGYEARLEGLGSPELVKAMRFGDWEVFVGQAFPEFSVRTHVIPPCMPPENAQVHTTFDWGFGKPFSWGWWFVDNDGRVIRFAEWYGWNGQPDQGLRLIDSEIAREIIRRERDMNLQERMIIRLAGHDCFARRPDFQGGGQGKSTAEIFAEHGLFLTKGDSTRHLKIRAFRERIRSTGDGTNSRPMLLVGSNCTEFIRTIPALVTDPANPEDIDSKGEDHVWDEACHIVMARPMAARQSGPAAVNAYARRIDRLESGLSCEGDRFEREMTRAFGREPSPWARAEMGEVLDDSSPC